MLEFYLCISVGFADSDLAVAGCWCCAKLSSQHACEVLEQTLSESTSSPKCAFVLSRARDGFSGSAPSWVRLRPPLRGRFQATKGPDVAWGTCVLSRTRDELNCYFLSRRGASGLTPAQDTTLKKMHNGGNTRRNRAQDELNRHVA